MQCSNDSRSGAVSDVTLVARKLRQSDVTYCTIIVDTLTDIESMLSGSQKSF